MNYFKSLSETSMWLLSARISQILNLKKHSSSLSQMKVGWFVDLIKEKNPMQYPFWISIFKTFQNLAPVKNLSLKIYQTVTKLVTWHVE